MGLSGRYDAILRCNPHPVCYLHSTARREVHHGCVDIGARVEVVN